MWGAGAFGDSRLRASYADLSVPTPPVTPSRNLVANPRQRLVAAKHDHYVEHGRGYAAAGQGGAQRLSCLAELLAAFLGKCPHLALQGRHRPILHRLEARRELRK